jgi:hypothetical protein
MANRSHAIYARSKRASHGLARRGTAGDEPEEAKTVRDLDRGFLVLDQSKQAEVDSLLSTTLQLRSAFVSSHSANGAMPNVLDNSKVAAAARAMDRLTNLVGELRQAHESSVKVAAALAGAVKLAQDGVIDISDVFDVAREAISNGTVKLSSADAVFHEKVGEVVGNAEAGEATKAATGAPVGAFSDVSGAHLPIDPLTSTLRTLRRS